MTVAIDAVAAEKKRFLLSLFLSQFKYGCCFDVIVIAENQRKIIQRAKKNERKTPKLTNENGKEMDAKWRRHGRKVSCG